MTFNIVDKLIRIFIRVNDIQDEIIWTFTSDENFSVNTATWANNVRILHTLGLIVKPHMETKSYSKNQTFCLETY